MKILIKFVLLFNVLFFSTALAVTTQQNSSQQPIMLQANKVIINLETALQTAKTKTNLPIRFPASIPVSSLSQKYYLSVFADTNNTQYILNIDATPTCNGVKYCNIGSIVVRVDGQIGADTMGHAKLTQTVSLANGQKAFYTPAHAEADFWPTTLAWKTGNLAYYLSWNIKEKNWDEKNIIIELANSMLQTKTI